jgi:hypothetical protein
MTDLRTPTETELRCWREEFEAAARRSLAERMRYAFIRTYKPVLDDLPYRSFERMADYRRWCQTALPAWLGYGSCDTPNNPPDERAQCDSPTEST